MIKQSCTLFWENSGKNKKKKIIKMINNLIKKERDEKSTKYKIKEGIKTFLYFFLILISKLVLNKMCSLFLLKF